MSYTHHSCEREEKVSSARNEIQRIAIITETKIFLSVFISLLLAIFLPNVGSGNVRRQQPFIVPRLSLPRNERKSFCLCRLGLSNMEWVHRLHLDTIQLFLPIFFSNGYILLIDWRYCSYFCFCHRVVVISVKPKEASRHNGHSWYFSSWHENSLLPPSVSFYMGRGCLLAGFSPEPSHRICPFLPFLVPISLPFSCTLR